MAEIKDAEDDCADRHEDDVGEGEDHEPRSRVAGAPGLRRFPARLKFAIDAHLDAGCDVVLVCAPTLVADSLKAMNHRSEPDRTVLAELMAKKTPDWDGLQAEARYDGVRTALSGSDFPVT